MFSYSSSCMLYSHEKLKIDIGLYDMETIIDLHGCYANPKETVLTTINGIINELKNELATLEDNYEDARYEEMQTNSDSEKEELIETELELSSQIDGVKDELNDFLTTKALLQNLPYIIKNYTYEEDYQKGKGLYEINLFNEEKSVFYGEKIIFETELSNYIINQIEKKLLLR